MTEQIIENNSSIPHTVATDNSFAQYIRDAFRLMRPFWLCDKKFVAWSHTLVIILIIILGAAFTAKVSFIYADLMNSVEAKDISEFTRLAMLYLGLTVISIAIEIVSLQAERMLVIHWRKWMTENLTNSYMGKQLYNQLELKNYGVDNPDQRLSMDILSLCEDSLDLSIKFVRNFAKLGTFSYVLWVVSGALEFTLWGMDFYIPGYMFWAALIYGSVVTAIIHAIGHPITRLENERLSVEADFRHQLIRVRENAESIALIGGGKSEAAKTDGLFSLVWSNYFRLLSRIIPLTGMQTLLHRMTLIFSIVMSLPGYLAGNMAVGGLLQIKRAFNDVTRAIEWFAMSYQQLAKWKASVDRILQLQYALNEAENEHRQCGFHFHQHSKDSLQVRNLNIRLPNGQSLLKNCDIELLKGKNTIITGTSGAGKSTFFRAISGLWVWGDGEIIYPSKSMMFIPQRPYLPLGTLRESLCYPHSVTEFGDEEIIAAMQRCDFGSFAELLDSDENWSRILSGGEQQRVAFVRVLLGKPEWLLMDEATSALDSTTEAIVYSAVRELLPDTTIVSIAHRESLRQYHDQHLELHPKTHTMTLNPITKLN